MRGVGHLLWRMNSGRLTNGVLGTLTIGRVLGEARVVARFKPKEGYFLVLLHPHSQGLGCICGDSFTLECQKNIAAVLADHVNVLG